MQEAFGDGRFVSSGTALLLTAFTHQAYARTRGLLQVCTPAISLWVCTCAYKVPHAGLRNSTAMVMASDKLLAVINDIYSIWINNLHTWADTQEHTQSHRGISRCRCPPQGYADVHTHTHTPTYFSLQCVLKVYRAKHRLSLPQLYYTHFTGEEPGAAGRQAVCLHSQS